MGNICRLGIGTGYQATRRCELVCLIRNICVCRLRRHVWRMRHRDWSLELIQRDLYHEENCRSDTKTSVRLTLVSFVLPEALSLTAVWIGTDVPAVHVDSLGADVRACASILRWVGESASRIWPQRRQ